MKYPNKVASLLAVFCLTVLAVGCAPEEPAPVAPVDAKPAPVSKVPPPNLPPPGQPGGPPK